MSVRKDVKNRFTDISPRFFDVYSVCSHLIAEIGKEAVRSWSDNDIDEKMDQFVGQMVQNGFPKSQAILAWKLVVQGNSKFEPTLNQIPSLPVATPIAPNTAAAAKDENVFSFEGGRWVVRFQGKTVYPNEVTGIKYLHCLISRSGEVIPARELYDDFGCRKRRKQGSAVSQLDAIDSGLGTGVAKSDVLIDERGRKEMLHRLEAIETEMVAAKRVPDADLIEHLASEKLCIQAELRKAFTPVGSRRIQEPERVRRMKAVDIAIRRAKEKIESAGHRSLVIHLNETIEVKVKSGCTYSPDLSVKWRTQPVSFAPPRRPR